MRKISSETYRGYPVNTGTNHDFSCNKMTLDQFIDIQEYMTKKHSRVLVTRLDIRTPIGSTVSLREKMPRILETTKRGLNRVRGKNSVYMHHVWTAEKKEAEGSEHVHLALLVNGNAIQNGYRLMSAVEEAVERHIPEANKGLVEFCESNGKAGILIDRNSPDFDKKCNQAVYAVSYLAKTSTKEHKAKGARFSSASRLPSDRR